MHYARTYYTVFFNLLNLSVKAIWMFACILIGNWHFTAKILRNMHEISSFKKSQISESKKQGIQEWAN